MRLTSKDEDSLQRIRVLNRAKSARQQSHERVISNAAQETGGDKPKADEHQRPRPRSQPYRMGGMSKISQQAERDTAQQIGDDQDRKVRSHDDIFSANRVGMSTTLMLTALSEIFRGCKFSFDLTKNYFVGNGSGLRLNKVMQERNSRHKPFLAHVWLK
jgi:hypothetical protein